MVPAITPEQMEQVVRRHIQSASLSVQIINPDYRSWRMEVMTPAGSLEFVWGLLSGFGVIDPRVESDNVFAYCDKQFESLEEAETYLVDFLSACQ